MKTTSYINEYIEENAQTKIIARADNIIRDGKIKLSEHRKKEGEAYFFALGTDIYITSVYGIISKKIETTCTCKYNYGGLCKHEVAALKYVEKYIMDDSDITILEDTEKEISLEEKIQKSVKANNKSHISQLYKLIAKKQPIIRDSTIPFIIKKYKNIKLDFIRKNTTSHIFEFINTPYLKPTIEDIVIDKDKISFYLTDNWDDIEIDFIFKDNSVLVFSNEEMRESGLKKNEAFCLTEIANSNSPDLFDIIFNHKDIDLKREFLAKYGIEYSEKEFNKHFTLSFELPKGISIKEKNSTETIIPITDDKSSILNLISESEKINSKTEIFKKTESRSIGFVLKKINSEYDYNRDSNYKIIPIVGKTNKAKSVLTSYIKKLSDINEGNFSIAMSKNAKELLNILEEIDIEKDKNTILQLYKIAFQHLENEQFVFGLKRSSYDIKKNNLTDINLSTEPLDILLETSINEDFIVLKTKFIVDKKPIIYSKLNKDKTDENIGFLNNNFHVLKNLDVSYYIEKFPAEIKMAKSHKDEFYSKVIKPLSAKFEIKFKKDTFNQESIELDFTKKQVYLSEQDDYLVITPQVVYDNNVSVILNTSGNILNKDDEKITEYVRNFELENIFIDLIAELHPNFEEQKIKKIFYIHNNEFTQDMWFYKFFDKLQSNNVEIFGLKDLKNFKYSPYKGKIETSIASGEDWFEVNVDVSFGDNTVSLKDIRKAVINKERYIKLNDGSVGILPSEWLNKLDKYFRNGEINKNKLEISSLRFSIIDELFDDIDDNKVFKEITEKRNRISNFKKISKTKIPKEIKADLRPYQKEGLNWLNFLDEMKWGGILADDMGLGKTLQILTFIQHIVKKDKTPNIIILPTTLLFNWKNEIEKFAPKIKALYHYGANRKRNTKNFAGNDIIFTTYGTLLRDITYIKDFTFNYAILDESQAIKNPASRRYKAANLINAKNRIALTGTPIENGTFDLFAQMNFANPGFFGGVQYFKSNYSNPIDKEGNENVAKELQKLINPFILRRTKEKVASELPAKTEDVIYCEMESEQRKTYDAYRNNYRDQLLNKIETDGMGKSKMMVLEALTRLRQICDSPVLLNNDEVSTTESIKIKEIVQHITSKTANHKILIFSQFVKMLGLIKDELNKRNIAYEYLDGKSKSTQREESVNNFQENENLRVFLISLKAGGTGLNLTAADYVYIVDPWWNPAVENQAIDRCYRIGQDKKVFAYRMICKNTVEEKILNLQAKKKKIASDIIQTEENIMKTIDTNDIKDLFS